MLTTVSAGPFTVRGISVGGVYTSLHVPELGALLDCGVAPRSFGAVDDLYLSHGHADHVGALTALLGLRGLMKRGPLRMFMPAQTVDPVMDAAKAMSRLQRYELTIDPIGVQPGDVHQIRSDLFVRAFPTFHPVPSLGYQFFRRVNKLKPSLRGLPGQEIAARRRAGEDIHDVSERLELAYATDTLLRVIDETPSILKSRVLIMECSFLDERKDIAASRAGCHIHLDEVLARADDFENDHLVLMHFSQIYKPDEVRDILQKRLPADLYRRVVAFAPKRKHGRDEDLAEMTIRPARDDEIATVRALFVEYADWLRVDLCFQGFEQELAELPGRYAPPRGGIWLAIHDGDIAGIVALRPLDPPAERPSNGASDTATDRAELKRLWVREGFRGHGFGRQLTVAAIEAARRAGYRTIRLDTLPFMDHARRLYHELGFRRIDAYYDNPHEQVVYMELSL